jgi:uracil-DNA glycosylase
MSILKNDWRYVLSGEFDEPYYIRLRQQLKKEYSEGIVYPNKHDIFNALHLTAYDSTKAVIVGQDPYHGEGQAHGLSFSVKVGIKPPPSLQNIFKELKEDLGYEIPNHGYLESWAKEGVLLLNSVLTVRQGEPNSHKWLGWELFTDKVIALLNKRQRPVVFILWGKHAQEKEALITDKQHHIIKAPHPSPLSCHRGFFGSRPFSRANEFLEANSLGAIDWKIRNICK